MLAAWGLDRLDWALLAIGGYIAVMTLVRLMRLRRDAILKELERQVEEEMARRKVARRQQEQRRFQAQLRERRAARRAA